MITFVGYLFLALFSLFGLSAHMHNGMPMQDCPYAIGTHSLCSMDTFAHIEVWQDMLRTLLPTIVILVIIAAIFITWRLNMEIGPPILLRRRPDRQISPYAELFSRGILNPKIP